ncbi:hypothetical protein PEBR_41311 [Penicillium brasilianum]|uniref:Antigenic cell wall galactomannoprotein n=1 Tax=Penicillium brasilianum TaxID=104259 RepID=A0A1S9R8M8_PENBI|nr:hypothetical protein PEBR_41311 [Penicillium brasilianum]
MVFIAKLLVLALTASATPILRRDAVTVENDITQKIGPQTKILDNDVNGFPASGLAGALAIDSDAKTLVTIVNSATSDVYSAGSFSEADGITILADVQELTSSFSGTLATLGDQAAAWADIPGGQALVLNDLQSLNTTFVEFANALIAAVPADLVPSAESIKTQITDAFSSEIAAYS